MIPGLAQPKGPNRQVCGPSSSLAETPLISNSPVIVVVPITKAANVTRSYPNNVALEQGDGGLTLDSVVLGGQVRAIAKSRLLRHRGTLSSSAIRAVERALRITLDL